MSSSAPIPIERLLAHREWVRHVARAMVRDENDADDLEGEMWLDALRRPLRSGRSLRGWIYTALRRDRVDGRRSEGARARRERAVAREDAFPSAGELVAKADAHRQVVVAVMELAEPYRTTILYRFFEDLPPSRIAERLGIPVETVRTRLKRAIAQLRERFDAEQRGDREAWRPALLPLFEHAVRTPAIGTATAVTTGWFLMSLKTKLVVALSVLAFVAAGLLLLTSESDRSPGPATGPKSPATAAVPTAGTATARFPASAEFGIDGVTRIGRDPAPAVIEVFAVGRTDTADDGGDAMDEVLGRPWYRVPGPPAATAAAESAGSGEFSLDGLGAGDWLAVATFADGRRAAHSVALTAKRPRARVELTAAAGGYRLHGRAVHADGTPFEGWVGLQMASRPPSAQVWIRSGPDGAFAFAGLPYVGDTVSGHRLPDARLQALQAGRMLTTLSIDLPHPDEIVVVVDPGGEIRHGRVVASSGGAPVSGAVVVVETGKVSSLASTGPDGRFDFTFSGGHPLVLVRAEGFATAQVRDDGAGEELLVALERRGRVTGRVVRVSDGSPVAGAVIHSAGPESGLVGRSHATSGADGRFSLEPCGVGRIDVFVLGGGWASDHLAEGAWRGYDPFLTEIAPGSSTDLLMRVVPSARVEGRVVDADGDPVASVTVHARRLRPPLSPLVGLPQRRARVVPLEVVSGADGSFGFPDLVPDSTFTFTVRPAAGEPKTTDPIRLESGRRTNVEIRLDPLHHIAVEVLAADTGAPIADAHVSISTNSHGPWDTRNGSSVPSTTDASGKADVVAPAGPGRVVVCARAAGYVEGQASTQEVDADTSRAVVRLERAKPLAGRVVVPDGMPWEGLRVVASHRPGTFVWTDVDGSGRFRFDDLADRRWLLSAAAVREGRRYRAEQNATPGDEDVVLTLSERPEPPALRVRVTDARGDPLAAGVVLYDSIGLRVQIHRGVALVPLPPGAAGVLEIRPRPPGGSGALRVELPDPLPAEFDVRLPEGLRIAGRVVGPTGEGVAGVSVVAQPVGQSVSTMRRYEDAHGVAVTDRNGDFEIGGLGELRYVLRSTAPPGLRPPGAVEAFAGATQVRIRLAAAVDVTVRVQGPDGAPLGECSVTAFAEGAGATSNRTSRAGAARLTGLDPATGYSLFVRPPEWRDDLVETTISSWRPRDTTVVLASPPGSISGLVRDEAGHPVPFATVLCEGSSRAWRVAADADGRFRVTGLRSDETVRFRVRLEDEIDRTWMRRGDERVSARAGSTDVVLVAAERDVTRFHIEGLPSGTATAWSLEAFVKNRWVDRGGGTLGPDGLLRFRCLDPTLGYRLFVGPTRDGRYALVEEIAVGAPEVVVRLVEGVPLTGKLVFIVGGERLSASDMVLGGELDRILVTASGEGWTAYASPDAHGGFRFPGLPGGPCRLGASASKDGKLRWLGGASTQAGAEVTIELEALPKRR